VTKKIDWAVRAAAYVGILDGRPLEVVAAEVGVAHRTVYLWARLVGMTFNAPRSGGGIALMPAVPPPPGRGRGYRRLALEDRIFIETARAEPMRWSVRRIAAHLGVAASTVSRELARHDIAHGYGRHVAGKEHHYSARVAHHRTLQTRHRPGPKKLDSPILRAAVVSQLNEKHSPQQAAHRLRLEFPDDPEMRVSHETIYQALYVQGRGALRHELTVEKALRSGRTTRKPHSKLPARSQRPWLDGAMITDRPAEAADRAIPGHWEGDLVVGPRTSGIVTLVERTTRFCLIGHLPGARDSDTVIDVMQGMVAGLPGELLRSLTWDQGSEMAHHSTFTDTTGCPVFFCDPHSPWQRGSNENLNGLIRDFYPKGTNFNTVPDADLAQTQRMLNDRPRMTLGWRTPREKLTELITGVALAT